VCCGHIGIGGDGAVKRIGIILEPFVIIFKINIHILSHRTQVVGTAGILSVDICTRLQQVVFELHYVLLQ
jgi:hypothetical protein